MINVINNYYFLREYGSKRLLSIETIPQWPEDGNHVSDVVTLNFSDNSQIVVTSSFADVDTFFDVEEDVVFSIREDSGYEPYCNVDGTNMMTIFVNEKINSIQVIFDEISYVDKSISDKTLTFPIGLFIKTNNRSIGISREILDATWLNADYNNADLSILYSIDARWEDFEDVDSFVVKRFSKDYLSDKIEIIEQKQYC